MRLPCGAARAAANGKDDVAAGNAILEPQYQIPHSGGINVAYLDGHIKWTAVPPLVDKQGKERNNLWCCNGVLETGWLQSTVDYSNGNTAPRHRTNQRPA